MEDFEEYGLAKMASANDKYSLESIVTMLMQGTDPEDLIEMGIPEELVVKAIKQLTAQMQAQQPANTEGGLASAVSQHPLNV